MKGNSTTSLKDSELSFRLYHSHLLSFVPYLYFLYFLFFKRDGLRLRLSGGASFADGRGMRTHQNQIGLRPGLHLSIDNKWSNIALWSERTKNWDKNPIIIFSLGNVTFNI